MTDQEPNRPKPMFHRLFGSNRTLNLCFVVYFLGGYTLIKEYLPDHVQHGLYILIAVGVVGGYLIVKRRRNRG